MLQEKIILECESKIDFIDTTKITHITIDSFNSQIHLADNSKFYSNYSLSFFESSLPETFIRVNRNSIVNIGYIKNIYKTTRKVQIERGIELCVSTRQMRTFIKRLKQLSARSTQNT
ncbi:MAG: LytTR family transcriptional regulator DNA-binding domain-containing protein [Bacteroidales bacterium]|jgi:DNA-binding LytR/AlgR family response regulator|nr:LytTR family transcriptional regulator DNA-binding domain-containing protein [Bacteroidales bacterium]